MPFCQVIVDINHTDVDHVFTYRVPAGLDVCPGMRVHVPFGPRKLEGVVVEMAADCDLPPERVKDICDTLEDYPAVLPPLLELAKEIQRTSFCTLAVALRLMFPAQMRGQRIREKQQEVAVLTVAPDVLGQVIAAQVRAPKRAKVLRALADAPEQQLMSLWQGLGYYSRVANMQKAAQIVCRQYGGQLPADYAALRALPGIGDYTAGAIASIAFGIPAPAVDGNVLRVFARLDNSSADITKPAAKREFTARVLEEMPKERPGPYNEALMELGALVCLPNGAPKCEVCPLAAQCKGRAAGRAEQLPVKTAKPEKTLVPVTAALITGPQGVLLQRRPSKGLLAGLWQPLAFEGTAMTQPELDAALRAIGLCVQWQAPLQSTRHVFTHRIWQISGFCGTAAGPAPEGCVWASRAELNGEYAVPSAFAGIMRQWQPE